MGCLKLSYYKQERALEVNPNFFLRVVGKNDNAEKNRLSSSTYGFQGQEGDDEIKGEGNSVNYKYRMHDPRIGRFFAVDPLASEYPYYTPYSFSGNKLISAVELEGLEELIYTKSFKNFGDHIECSILHSDHLKQIMTSVSDPRKAEKTKVYMATSDSFFTGGKENGYATSLTQWAKWMVAFENKHKDDMEDMDWEIEQLNSGDTPYKTYLDKLYIFEGNDIDYKSLFKKSQEDPNFQAYLIILMPENLDNTNSAMKTFFHEVELHLQRRLGIRKNPDGLPTGESDHRYGHAYEKNKKHYNKNGWTDKAVKDGYSPRREHIVKDSPTGKTNSEVDKVPYE